MLRLIGCRGMLMLKSTDMTDDLKVRIAQAAVALKAAGAGEVYLFGSAATGILHVDSDTDLAVTGLRPKVFFKAMGKAGCIPDHPLDFVDLEEDNSFTQ